MQYAIVEGGRGICPPGWHVPTDDEWKILEGAADSQYGISDPVWDLAYGRGSDVGTNLKASAGWDNNGNGTDRFGFSGLPGGHRWMDGGTFHGIGLQGFWWTSTEGFPTSIWRRYLYSDFQDIDRYYGYDIGISVRCIRD